MKGQRKPKVMRDMADPNNWGPDKLLENIQTFLITKPNGWFNQCVKLNDLLVSYLRGNGRDANWDLYPIARDWFTQNNNGMKPIEEA